MKQREKEKNIDNIKRKIAEILPEEPKLLDLLDKDFKSVILKHVQNLYKAVNLELNKI